MARERQGMWLSGLQDVKGGLDNPVNQAPSDWFAVQESNLAQSFELQQESQSRRDVVYSQQQQRHFQPKADSMTMWENIYNVVADNITAVGSAIRDKTVTHQNVAVMRPSVLYLDPFGNQAHNQNLALINSKRYEM
jgi:hypothetical protein